MDANPQIYALFRRFATQMLERNKRFGISQLTERVRWEIALAWQGEYKINNNHRAYVARRLLAEMPGLEPLIKLRRVRY